jgi:hypothetical protein
MSITPEVLNSAAVKFLNNLDAIKILLGELAELDVIYFDSNSNPYWESCGEPLIKGTSI